MSWPLSQDYNEAIQSPAGNFSDPDLKRGEAVANALGLPMPYSGNFADVYQVRCPDGKSWAVKCFTREAEGLRERYQEISAHLKQARLPFTVDFSYLDKGIRVAGQWYPVLKMQWVEGLTLNQFIGQNLEKPAMLEALLQLWAKMGKFLRAAEIGHCDLQHGNVLLVPGATPNSLALKLIDYDGMWVPALAGNKSGEVGHANYQHPRRLREGTYSLEVDRFPLLLVATAMRALKADKELWAKYDNGDNMLFKESDLAAPAQSEVFEELASLPDPGLVMLAAQVRAALKGPLESAVLLEDAMPDAKGAPAPAKPPRSATATQATAPKPKAVPVASPVAVSRAAPAPASDALAFDAADDAAVSSFIRKRDRSKGIRGGGMRRVPVAAWVGGGVALMVLMALAGGLAVWALGGTPSAPTPTGPDKRLAQKDPVAPPPRDVKPDPGKNKTPTPTPPPDDPLADPVVPPKPPTDPVVPAPPVEPPAGQPVRELFTVADHGSGPIRVLCVSRDGKQGISLDANKLLQRFSLKDGATITSNSLETMAPQAAALLPGGERVLLGCKDGSLRVLDMVNPQQTPPFKVRVAAGPVGSVAWVDLSPDPDGAQALSCGDDGSIFLWDVKKGEEIRHWKGSEKPITSVRFSPDGKSAVSCGQDETAHLWNLANGHETGKIERVRPDNAGKPLTAVFLSPDTALVGFTTTSGHWDIKNNHSTSSFGGGANRAVAGSWDGRLTAFAAESATEFIVLDEKKAGVFWPCRGMPSIAPECLVFTPDGRHILAGCLDGTIHYWEVNGVPPAPGQQAPDSTIPNSIGKNPPSPNFAGKWRVVAPDGKTACWFTLKAAPDGSLRATKSHVPNATGTCEVVGDEVRITWSDGFWDCIRPTKGAGMTDVVFNPGNDPGKDWDGGKADHTDRIVKEP